MDAAVNLEMTAVDQVKFGFYVYRGRAGSEDRTHR